MSCPHSTALHADPSRCSMCLGIVAKLVEIRRVENVVIMDDAEFTMTESMVFVDGVKSDRDLIPEKIDIRDKSYRGSSERRCSLCGKLDHTRNKCESASTSLSNAGGIDKERE